MSIPQWSAPPCQQTSALKSPAITLGCVQTSRPFPRFLWKFLLTPPGKRKGSFLNIQEHIHIFLSKFQMHRRGLEVNL